MTSGGGALGGGGGVFPPPQVVPSVPGVSADPTEHWRPGVGVVEFTAAAVKRGLVLEAYPSPSRAVPHT